MGRPGQTYILLSIIRKTQSMATISTADPSNKKRRRRSFSQNLVDAASDHPLSVLSFLSLWFDQQIVTLRKFLRKSSARDKLLATIQYTYQYKRAMLSEDAPPSVGLVFTAFEDNISDARKGFRLFKWIDEYGKIRKIVLAPSRTLTQAYWKVVPILMRLCACGYYLVDNALWVATITQGARYGKRNKKADQYMKDLKRFKNNFSLWRTIIALGWGARLVGILAWYRPTKGKEGIDNPDNQIITTRPWHECMLFHTILQFRGMMNFLILAKHLRLFKMSDSWVGRLGFMASFLGMWKHWGVKMDYCVEFKK